MNVRYLKTIKEFRSKLKYNREIKHYIKDNELDLETIIKEFTPYISKVIDNMVQDYLNDEDKEEIASDVFFILWNNKEKLDVNRLMSSYLAGITKNVVKEKIRKKKVDLDISEYENTLFDNNDNLDILFDDIEEINKIEKILSKIKEIDKQIFISFYYYSKSIKDIAKEQRISEFNVKQRLYRIRNKIRKEVNKNG